MSEPGSEQSLQRPYLLRAMHEWMTDNNLTPHIVIDVAAAQTALPVEYAKEGKLVINVSYSATENLLITNDSASFSARFGGVSRYLDVPVAAILGIYARESGQGMIFASEQAASDVRDHEAALAGEQTPVPDESSQESVPETTAAKPGRSRPQLKVIK